MSITYVLNKITYVSLIFITFVIIIKLYERADYQISDTRKPNRYTIC